MRRYTTALRCRPVLDNSLAERKMLRLNLEIVESRLEVKRYMLSARMKVHTISVTYLKCVPVSSEIVPFDLGVLYF